MTIAGPPVRSSDSPTEFAPADRRSDASAGSTASPNLHRNNAAEWVMFAAVWPVAGAVRLWMWLGRRFRRRIDGAGDASELG
jgi:hypothetical protein